MKTLTTSKRMRFQKGPKLSAPQEARLRQYAAGSPGQSRMLWLINHWRHGRYPTVEQEMARKLRT